MSIWSATFHFLFLSLIKSLIVTYLSVIIFCIISRQPHTITMGSSLMKATQRNLMAWRLLLFKQQRSSSKKAKGPVKPSTQQLLCLGNLLVPLLIGACRIQNVKWHISLSIFFIQNMLQKSGYSGLN